MKKIGTALILAGLLLFVYRIILQVNIHFQYKKEFTSYWDLSVKASDLSLKYDYLSEYIDKLERASLKGTHDAYFSFSENDNNSFDENFKALKSLKNRIHQSLYMDITSIQYQEAMKQITEQEQDEADEMLTVLENCWYKKNHYSFYYPHYAIGFYLMPLILIPIGSFIRSKSKKKSRKRSPINSVDDLNSKWGSRIN